MALALALAVFPVPLGRNPPPEELGVGVEAPGAFVKKLCMERCLDAGPEPELCCFCVDGGRAGVEAGLSWPFAILKNLCGETNARTASICTRVKKHHDSGIYIFVYKVEDEGSTVAGQRKEGLPVRLILLRRAVADIDRVHGSGWLGGRV